MAFEGQETVRKHHRHLFKDRLSRYCYVSTRYMIASILFLLFYGTYDELQHKSFSRLCFEKSAVSLRTLWDWLEFKKITVTGNRRLQLLGLGGSTVIQGCLIEIY